MGWLGLAIASPIYQNSPRGLGALVLGGAFFTVGAIIFYLEKPNPIPGRFGFHEIWHFFVLAGAASHFFVMYAYLKPLP
jgi:hemolysin III